MGATTDSMGKVQYDYETQPGVSNLLDMLATLSNEPIGNVVKRYEGQVQYGPLKKDVAEAVKTFLTDFQGKLANVNTDKLMHKLESSEAEMNVMANSTLTKVQKAVGLRQ